MAKHNVGRKNGMWRGGRTIASSGYVLVRVGVDHHLADQRGYAYEHRIEAEKMLGRTLAKGEIVHHRDGDKLNNTHSNLEVVESIAHHRAHHRKRTDLRDPGAQNSTTSCACGCGEQIQRFDTSGRPRRFISGHNLMKGRCDG